MKQQQGFSIVMAIFVLVVMGLLGGYLVRLSGVQHMTVAKTLQGARAYHAARAGLEWAIARINSGGTCADVNAQVSMTFTDIVGYTVNFTCNSSIYAEGSKTPVVYQIKSQGEFGAYSSDDYVSRQLEVSFVMGG